MITQALQARDTSQGRSLSCRNQLMMPALPRQFAKCRQLQMGILLGR